MNDGAGGALIALLADQAAAVVAAYAQAVADAEHVRALLVAAELDLRGVQVVASVTETGTPVVYLTPLTEPIRARLADILHGDTEPARALWRGEGP